MRKLPFDAIFRRCLFSRGGFQGLGARHRLSSHLVHSFDALFIGTQRLAFSRIRASTCRAFSMSSGLIPGKRIGGELGTNRLELLDERLCLHGDMQAPRPPVCRVRHAFDEPAFFQPVDDPRQGDRLDIQHVGQLVLAQAGLPRQAEQHFPLRAVTPSPIARRSNALRSACAVSPISKGNVSIGNGYSKPAYIKQRLNCVAVPAKGLSWRVDGGFVAT